VKGLPRHWPGMKVVQQACTEMLLAGDDYARLFAKRYMACSRSQKKATYHRLIGGYNHYFLLKLNTGDTNEHQA